MICERAEANAAAVNYHFGDKLGLYTEILKSSFGDEKLQLNGQQLLDMEPEAALSEFISRFFYGLLNSDGKQRHMRIMGHELSQPTPALPIVVEQIMRPQFTILTEIVSRIAGSRAESRATALAAHSVIAQVTQYVNAQLMLNLLLPKWPAGPGKNEETVAHIIKFSLGGLRALQGDAGKQKRAAPKAGHSLRRGRER